MWDQLLQLDPSHSKYQRERAMVFLQKSRLLLQNGQAADALSAAQSALRLLDQLSRRDPSNAEWRFGSANGLLCLADALHALKHWELALAKYHERIEVCEALVKMDATNLTWKRGLAISLGRMADMRIERRNLSDAANYLEKARAILEEAHREAPDSNQVTNDFASVLYSFAKLEGERRRFYLARAMAQRAVQLFGALLKRGDMDKDLPRRLEASRTLAKSLAQH